MRIIKDNKNKEYKITCKYCSSRFAFKVGDIHWYLTSSKVTCPICNAELYVKRICGHWIREWWY